MSSVCIVLGSSFVSYVGAPIVVEYRVPRVFLKTALINDPNGVYAIDAHIIRPDPDNGTMRLMGFL